MWVLTQPHLFEHRRVSVSVGSNTATFKLVSQQVIAIYCKISPRVLERSIASFTSSVAHLIPCLGLIID